MKAQHRTKTDPVRVYTPDPELNTTRRKNVYWRITCSRCGTEARGRYPSQAMRELDGHPCVDAAKLPASGA